MITTNSDNIINKAQNTKHKSIEAQTQKYNDYRKQNKTPKKSVQPCMQYNKNTILEVSV